MSEQHFSSSPFDFYAFGKNPFLSSADKLRRNFWYKQDHCWPGWVTDFDKNIQNTTSAEKRSRTSKVSYRLKKMEMGLFGFHKESKSFFVISCQKKRLDYSKTNNLKMNCVDETNHSILEIPMQKSVCTFEEQTKIPHKVKKKKKLPTVEKSKL